ncbi:hypothetical protein [Burkholderia pseudomultivorans]|uniref:hypothetical protein n=1 Tax=Burkholderia pseudomultivorans TaxID=1207504 RepID=UPI0012D9E5D0|nr:hypothetical protein [Burkholderia pseudomultivorans]
MVDDPRIVNTISFWQNQELVDALISLPEPQLVEVIALRGQSGTSGMAVGKARARGGSSI